MESAGKFWRISVSKGLCRGVSVSHGSLVAHVLDGSSKIRKKLKQKKYSIHRIASFIVRKKKTKVLTTAKIS